MVSASSLPRVINSYREPAPLGDPDRRDRLVVRLDREPTDAEMRLLIESDVFSAVRDQLRSASFCWPNEAEASLNTLGFLSPEIERFREHVRVSPQAKPWLDFARELTTFGLDILLGIDIPKYEGDLLTAAALFGRTHESMQAAVTLAERGMVGDARAVARSAIENTIGLHALAGGDKFTDRLLAAKAHSDLQVARMLLNVGSVRARLTPEQVATVEGMEAKCSAVPKVQRQPINWADLARDYGCGDLYQTLYRLLSEDGTHVSVSAIIRRFERQDDGEITMMKCGPDTDGLVVALNAACTAFLNSVEPILKLYPNEANASRLASLVDRFKGMAVEAIDWSAPLGSEVRI